MQAVVERLWDGYAELDFVTDRLRPRVREEARLVGVPPKLEIELPRYVAGPAPVLSADARVVVVCVSGRGGLGCGDKESPSEVPGQEGGLLGVAG